MKARALLTGIFAPGLVLGALMAAAPATAQWSRIASLPAAPVHSVWASGDTIVAGADTSAYLSTDAGVTWRLSTKTAPGVTTIPAVWWRAGRLYAGTLGQGVHVSDDLGATWHPFNEGLVGGFDNSQLNVIDFQVRDDVLVAATSGAGAYARNLANGGTWQRFGTAFEPLQASNLNALGLGANRLLAMGGGNGLVLHNDSGETDWTASALDTVKVHGLEANSAIWTGSSWIVGSNLGIFRSVAGEEPWTRFNPGLGVMNWTALATHEGRVFAALNTGLGAVMEESDDDGATWRVNEVESGAFVQKLAVSGDGLFAARRDGLWRRPLAVTGVESAATPGTLRFAVAGPQPSGDPMRLRFDLPRSGAISIELFDVHGRLVGDRVEGNWASGRHEVALDAKRLGSGVFFARITADGRSQVVRLVRIR